MALHRSGRIIIHDLAAADWQRKFPALGEEAAFHAKDQRIAQCVGCFGCWVKTPGQCVLKDEFNQMGGWFDEPTEEIILISECVYGGFSPAVKNVLDRSIGFMLPFFSVINGELHHRPRTQNRPRISAYFYGHDITPGERKTAEELVQANALNLNAGGCSVHFYHEIDELEAGLL